MEILIDESVLDECLKDDSIRHKHRENREFLKLALTNVNLARRLNLKEGLTYNCEDGSLFNVSLPSGKNALYSMCGYRSHEPRVVIASHYVFLKNGWLEPVDLDDVVNEVNTAYPPITLTLSCGKIRRGLTECSYSKRLFSHDMPRNTIKPIFLPIDIRLT